LVTVRLPERLFSLLREVLERQAPELLSMLRDGSQVVLRANQRSAVQDPVGNEFIETGLRVDNEPNQRGHDLEMLIDAFSPNK